MQSSQFVLARAGLGHTTIEPADDRANKLLSYGAEQARNFMGSQLARSCLVSFPLAVLLVVVGVVFSLASSSHSVALVPLSSSDDDDDELLWSTGGLKCALTASSNRATRAFR